MKRTIALLLTALLVLGCAPALAEYGEEITFLGLPWGETTLEDFYQTIAQNGLTDEENAEDFAENQLSDSWAELYYLPDDLNVFNDFAYEYLYLDDLAYDERFKGIADNYYLDDDDFSDVTVAGYIPFLVEFFLYHGFENGQIDPEKKEFLSVTVSYLDNDHAGEMIQNLNDQYGRFDYRKTGEGGTALYIWYGANNTAVVLSTEGDYVLKLFYTHTDLGARIPAMVAAAEGNE